MYKTVVGKGFIKFYFPLLLLLIPCSINLMIYKYDSFLFSTELDLSAMTWLPLELSLPWAKQRAEISREVLYRLKEVKEALLPVRLPPFSLAKFLDSKPGPFKLILLSSIKEQIDRPSCFHLLLLNILICHEVGEQNLWFLIV